MQLSFSEMVKFFLDRLRQLETASGEGVKKIKAEVLERYKRETSENKRIIVSHLVAAMKNLRQSRHSSELLIEISKTDPQLVVEFLRNALAEKKTHARAELMLHLETIANALTEQLKIPSQRINAEKELIELIALHPQELTEALVKRLKERQITQVIQELLVHAIKLRTEQRRTAPTAKSIIAERNLEDLMRTVVVECERLSREGEETKKTGIELLRKVSAISHAHGAKVMTSIKIKILDRHRFIDFLMDLNTLEAKKEITSIMAARQQAPAKEPPKKPGREKPKRRP